MLKFSHTSQINFFLSFFFKLCFFCSGSFFAMFGILTIFFFNFDQKQALLGCFISNKSDCTDDLYTFFQNGPNLKGGYFLTFFFCIPSISRSHALLKTVSTGCVILFLA